MTTDIDALIERLGVYANLEANDLEDCLNDAAQALTTLRDRVRELETDNNKLRAEADHAQHVRACIEQRNNELPGNLSPATNTDQLIKRLDNLTATYQDIAKASGTIKELLDRVRELTNTNAMLIDDKVSMGLARDSAEARIKVLEDALRQAKNAMIAYGMVFTAKDICDAALASGKDKTDD